MTYSKPSRRPTLAITLLGIVLVCLLGVPAFASALTPAEQAEADRVFAKAKAEKAEQVEQAKIAQGRGTAAYYKAEAAGRSATSYDEQQSARELAAKIYVGLSGAEKAEIIATKRGEFGGIKGRGDVGGIKPMVMMVWNWAWVIGTLLAVVNLIWQGLKLMGMPAPGATLEANAAIIKSLQGLAIILFAWIIVGAVVHLLGGAPL